MRERSGRGIFWLDGIIALHKTHTERENNDRDRDVWMQQPLGLVTLSGARKRGLGTPLGEEGALFKDFLLFETSKVEIGLEASSF